MQENARWFTDLKGLFKYLIIIYASFQLENLILFAIWNIILGF